MLVSWAAGCTSLLLADMSQPPVAGSQPQTSPAPAARGIKVFDDRVFQLSDDNQGRETTKSPVSGTERYLGAEPDYNQAQREEWLTTCAPLRDQDAKAYRDCFNREKAKSLQDVRSRLGDSTRGVAPEQDQIPLLKDPAPKEPVFGGVSVDRK